MRAMTITVAIRPAAGEVLAAHHVQVGVVRLNARVDDGNIDVDALVNAVDSRRGTFFGINAINAPGHRLCHGEDDLIRLHQPDPRVGRNRTDARLRYSGGEPFYRRLVDLPEAQTVLPRELRRLPGRVGHLILKQHNILVRYQKWARPSPLRLRGERRVPQE
jgi:hypothetical protein